MLIAKNNLPDKFKFVYIFCFVHDDSIREFTHCTVFLVWMLFVKNVCVPKSLDEH